MTETIARSAIRDKLARLRAELEREVTAVAYGQTPFGHAEGPYERWRKYGTATKGAIEIRVTAFAQHLLNLVAEIEAHEAALSDAN